MHPLASRSFYRDLLHDAWQTAWHNRLGWILAIGAGLLQTGGIIDVLYRVFQQHLTLLTSTQRANALWNTWESSKQIVIAGGTRFGQIMTGIKLGETFLLALLLGLTVLALAIVCQGALVYLIGARGRFTKPTLREALKVGGERFWAVAALNFLPAGAYIFAWFICLAPFGTLIKLTTSTAVIGYVVAVTIALILGFIATALHLLALQDVVLQETHVLPAIQKAWDLTRRSWLTLLEASLGLFIIGVVIFLVSFAAFVILVLPLLAIVGIAIVLQAPTIANTVLMLCLLFFIVMMGSAGGFTITFQYIVWNRLSSRLQKNLAIAKIVRSVHQLLDRLNFNK